MKLDSRILIITAVSAERDAIRAGLNGAGRFDVAEAGVGPAAAAAGTAMAIAVAMAGTAGAGTMAGARAGYGLVISAGIGGGFPGVAEIGSIVIADLIIAADLGAETREGFLLSLEELGFGATRIQADAGLAGLVAQGLARAGVSAQLGHILTLSTATGTVHTASELLRRFPDAAAESMEGFGTATAAVKYGLPVLEIRAISNSVGPRDRCAWRIGEALQALEKAASILAEVFA